MDIDTQWAMRHLQEAVAAEKRKAEAATVSVAARRIASVRTDMKLPLPSGTSHRCSPLTCDPHSEEMCIVRGLYPSNTRIANPDVFVCNRWAVHVCTPWQCDYVGVCPVSAIERTPPPPRENNQTAGKEYTADCVEDGNIQDDTYQPKTKKQTVGPGKRATSKAASRASSKAKGDEARRKRPRTRDTATKRRGPFQRRCLVEDEEGQLAGDELPGETAAGPRARPWQQRAGPAGGRGRANAPPPLSKRLRRAKADIESTVHSLLFNKTLREKANEYAIRTYRAEYLAQMEIQEKAFKAARRCPNSSTIRSNILAVLRNPHLYGVFEPQSMCARYCERLHAAWKLAVETGWVASNAKTISPTLFAIGLLYLMRTGSGVDPVLGYPIVVSDKLLMIHMPRSVDLCHFGHRQETMKAKTAITNFMQWIADNKKSSQLCDCLLA